jgi:HEAT repeat protein
MSPERELEAMFQADRELRAAESRLLEHGDREAVEEAIARAVEGAAAAGSPAESAARLIRLADLCAELPGPRMADTLVRILNDEEPAVRVAAGEALLDVGYERYAEVARAIERALDAPLRGPALSELPWIVAEIGEPSALKLVKRFLDHPDPEVIAAGIEALAELGDPAAIPALSRFEDDGRTVALEDLEDEAIPPATLGELARDCVRELQSRK